MPTVCIFTCNFFESNKDTRKSEQIICDPQLANCKEGDIIQLQRRGFFRVDRPYKPVDGATFNDSPAVLFAIPDGRTKAGFQIDALSSASDWLIFSKR